MQGERHILLYSDSRNKYRTQGCNTKVKLPSSHSMLDNHIIITPTSTGNAKGKEYTVPRFGKPNENVRSYTKLDISEDPNRTGHNYDSMLGNITWDNKSFKKQRAATNEPDWQTDEFPVEITNDREVSKMDTTLAQTFVSECETLDGVITKLIKEINTDQRMSDQNRQEK